MISNVCLVSSNWYYSSASWLEREVWDLFGLRFFLHIGLRRILNDYGFIGYPLRKDFPLVGFTEVCYDDISKSVILEPVELMQDFSSFIFLIHGKF